MSRAQRLLELLQLLRQHRRAVAGEVLAERLGVSLRTLYRDIDTLRAQGARIEAEAGLGYLLLPGFMLPPLMFSHEEIQAVLLGMRWVAESGDAALAGMACRQGAAWRVDALQSVTIVPGASDGYRQAATSLPPLILRAAEESMAGDALDAVGEAEARDQNWRTPAVTR